MEYNILMDFAEALKELMEHQTPDWERIDGIREHLKEVTAEDFSYDGDAWLEWLWANDYDTCHKGFYARINQRQQQQEEADNDSKSQESGATQN